MEELAAWCAKLGVEVPPIPPVFLSHMRLRATNTYGTLKPPFTMYDAQHWGFSDQLPDFVVVGHGGHGANSYVLGYALGLGSLRVVVQIGYGGAYMDLARSQQDATNAFAAVARVIEAWKQAHKPRLSIAAHDFYESEWTLEGVKHKSRRTHDCFEEVLRALGG